MVIVIFGSDDINELYATMAKNDDNSKWKEVMKEFFAVDAKSDGTDTQFVEKIFDINEQSNGYLDKEC